MAPRLPAAADQAFDQAASRWLPAPRSTRSRPPRNGEGRRRCLQQIVQRKRGPHDEPGRSWSRSIASGTRRARPWPRLQHWPRPTSTPPSSSRRRSVLEDAGRARSAERAAPDEARVREDADHGRRLSAPGLSLRRRRRSWTPRSSRRSSSSTRRRPRRRGVPTPAAPRPAVRPPRGRAGRTRRRRARRVEVEPAGPLSDDDREFIEEHVAEGRVFRKYGLLDKAADQVRGGRRALPREPGRAHGAARPVQGEGRAGSCAPSSARPSRDLPAARGDDATADAYEKRRASCFRARPGPPRARALRARGPPRGGGDPARGRERGLSLEEGDEEEIPLEMDEPLAVAVEGRRCSRRCRPPRSLPWT